jgi:hypothetical protein
MTEKESLLLPLSICHYISSRYILLLGVSEPDRKLGDRSFIVQRIEAYDLNHSFDAALGAS